MRVKGLNVDGIVRISNARVYGMSESIIASGYPMSTEYCEDMSEYDLKDSDIMRGSKLGNAAPGSGHDCYLKGIQLQFDLQAPEYIWRQLDRYHFIDYVSSQSKMHRILKFDMDEICNKYVTKETIDNLNSYIGLYNNFDDYVKLYEVAGTKPTIKLRNGEVIEYTKENIFRIIIANCPCGLMLTARMTTNYLQLKSIINQRSNHKMQEWRYITEWMKTLPLVNKIVMKKEEV